MKKKYRELAEVLAKEIYSEKRDDLKKIMIKYAVKEVMETNTPEQIHDEYLKYEQGGCKREDAIYAMHRLLHGKLIPKGV